MTGQPVYAPVPQAPPQANYSQQPQYGQQPGYPQQPQGGFGGLSSTPVPNQDRDEDDDDDAQESSANLRENANATMGQSDRVRFIRKTYAHLFGAMLAFAGLLWHYHTDSTSRPRWHCSRR